MFKKNFMVLIIILFAMSFISCGDNNDNVNNNVKSNNDKENESEKQENIAENNKETNTDTPNPETQGISDNEIKIGMSAVMTGPLKDAGRDMYECTKMYIEDINEKGGIHGRKINLIFYDDAYNPPRAIENTKKLINEDKVFALLNYFGTHVGISIVPLLKQNKIPLLGIGSGSPVLRTEFNKYLFHTIASYEDEIQRAIDYFVSDEKLSKISIVYINDPFGASLLRAVEKALEKHNLKLLSFESHEPNQTDFANTMDKIFQKDEKPEVIIMGTYGVEQTKNIMKEGYERNKDTKYFNLSIGINYQLVLSWFEDTPDLADKLYQTWSLPFYKDTEIPIVKNFNEFIEENNYQPAQAGNLSMGFQNYINVKILEEALRKAGKDLTRTKLIKELEKMNNYDLGGMIINFSPENHEGTNKVYLKTIDTSNKGLKYVDAK